MKARERVKMFIDGKNGKYVKRNKKSGHEFSKPKLAPVKAEKENDVDFREMKIKFAGKYSDSEFGES